MTETVVVTQVVNDVIISTPGPQGPRGRTILNGTGVPSNNLGLEGDFYYNKDTTRLYGPKLNNITWAGATNYLLSSMAFVYSWEIAQVVGPDADGLYGIQIIHNMEYYPNVTVKSSSGDILETGIDYNSNNKITLTMAQPFAGTAYLS